jgi:tartrate-resistant acid phosphatase type 5
MIVRYCDHGDLGGNLTRLASISRRSFLAVLGGLALGRKQNAWAAEPGTPFLVVGDWGTGSAAQKRVAIEMGKIAESIGVRFVISTGDNFYSAGVKGIDDAQWKTSYEDIYDAPSLMVPWYAVLGNHDHKGNVAAQVEYTKQSSRWRMFSTYYRHTEVLRDGTLADFFFIDTESIRTQYQDWVNLFRSNDQIAWLDRELGNSTARWKIVVGHHPIFSGESRRGGTPALINWLRPLLDKHRVQVYLNGHSHGLEHIVVGQVHYLTSGAGASPRPSGTLPTTRFAMGNRLGYLVARLSPEFMDIEFRDEVGNSVYRARI